MAEAAPAPPAHDPGHRADQDQAAASEPVAGLVIEHHQQGTLVHGTQKDDYQLRRALHDHGFRWSGSLSAWYLPRPWTFSTRNRRVTGLTVSLRQAHRSFTMRTQPPATTGTGTGDSSPEPLPPADPYSGIRQARSDHFQAVSDYWALTRTPAGNNVMAAYPGSGARPDALALNAAYKAVPASLGPSVRRRPAGGRRPVHRLGAGRRCPGPQPRRRTASRPEIPADARHLHRLRHPAGQPHPGHRPGPRRLGARVR